MRVPPLSRSLFAVRVASFVLVAVLSFDVPGLAQEPPDDEKPAGDAAEKAAPRYDLIAWGELKPMKGSDGFFALAYTVHEKGKRRPRSAFVKIGADLKVLVDRRVAPKNLAAGGMAWVLAKQRSNSVVSPLGVSTTEYSLASVEAVFSGRSVKANAEYRDPRDAAIRWYEGTLGDPGANISIEIDGKSHRALVDKRTLFIDRGAGEPADVLEAKRPFSAFILATRSEERPPSEKKSDAATPSFETARVIVLDPTAVKAGVYQKLYE